MTAFASELQTSIAKLKFSFDGDIINPSQSAQELDMENDDCIDVSVLKWSLYSYSAIFSVQ